MSLQESSNEINKSFQNSIIVLDVGGMIYKTTIDTLRNCPDSYFSGLTKFLKNSNEPYFIDRSPEYFPYILDYLRNTYLPLKLYDEKTLYNIYQEANYYCLSTLKSEIEKISPRCEICQKLKIETYNDNYCELNINDMYHPGIEYKVYEPPLFRIGDEFNFRDERNAAYVSEPVKIIDITENKNGPRLLKISFDKWSFIWIEWINEFSDKIILSEILTERVKDINCKKVSRTTCCNKQYIVTQGCKFPEHKFKK